MKTYNTYIFFLSDLMAIEPPIVVYKENGKCHYGDGKKTKNFQLKPTAKATTVVKENTIYIDLDRFNNEIDVYLSLAHEVRHCAQYQSLNDVGLYDIGTPEMLKKWKEELNTYKGSETKGYEIQHIELDANAFTWFIGRSVFGVEVTINNLGMYYTLQDQYNQYIYNNYSQEEVRDCLEYSGFQYSKNQA